ncbi:hypothetical protein Tco_0807279, partial [Tanacetum coccineum]
MFGVLLCCLLAQEHCCYSVTLFFIVHTYYMCRNGQKYEESLAIYDGGGWGWWWRRCLVVMVVGRLGGGEDDWINILNPTDIIELLNGEQLWTNILTLSQVSLGIMGGRPGASTYLIGVQEDKVFSILIPMKFNSTKQVKIAECGLSYIVVAIMGPQRSDPDMLEAKDRVGTRQRCLHAHWMSTSVKCFSVLKPGGLLFFTDYGNGLYDMTMLHFEADQRVGCRQTGQAFRLDAAKQKATELEADGNDDLDFGLNILAMKNRDGQKSCPHPKLSNDQDGVDSDLLDLTDSDNVEDEDEYDQLPLFKPLKKPFSTSMITGLLSVETTDRHRPGLFVDLVKIVTDISVAVESGEFDTE